VRILVVGGNGNLGRELIPALLHEGHQVAVLDKELGAVRAIAHPQLLAFEGGVEDETAVSRAVAGADAVVHLAWSFSDDPRYLLEHDLRGHALLLEAAQEQHVSHFLYASTAVVYGTPVRTPIDEEHPLRVLEARKPAYGMAKEYAEKLTLQAARAQGFAGTIFRFWWAFGDTIGGKHLREMLRTAAAGSAVSVPANAGGSFLTQEDFNRAVLAALKQPAPGGRVFNLSSAYVTWEEVARMVVDATGSAAPVRVIPSAEWAGAAFLADPWQLDDRKVRAQLGFTPARDALSVRAALGQAIARTWHASAVQKT
jgi:UDP-glucose 4-epimerase